MMIGRYFACASYRIQLSPPSALLRTSALAVCCESKLPQSTKTARLSSNDYQAPLMNKIDLNGRAAVVTGAARGIGYAIAHRLLQSGAAVSIWDIDPAALRSAGQRLSEWGRVAAEEVDVSDENAVSRAMQSTIQRFGKIDLLINNAG